MKHSQKSFEIWYRDINGDVSGTLVMEKVLGTDRYLDDDIDLMWMCYHAGYIADLEE